MISPMFPGRTASLGRFDIGDSSIPCTLSPTGTNLIFYTFEGIRRRAFAYVGFSEPSLGKHYR